MKTLKKSLAAFLVVLMLLTSAPLAGFVGWDLPNVTEMFSAVANAKEEKGAVISSEDQEVLDELGIDPNNLIEDIDLGDGEMQLPTIPINGKEYNLGTIAASVKLPLKHELEVKVNTEKKTIEILGGYKEKESATIGPDGQTTNYWSESYESVKNLYTNVTGNKVDTTKLWNQFSSLRGEVKELKCSMGVSVTAKCCLFAKLSYEKGDWEFVEGGVVVAVKAGVELTAPVFVPAIYVGLGLEPSIGGKLALKKDSSKVSVGGEVNGELAASIIVGIGDRKVTHSYIEGRITGAIAAKYAFPAESLSDGFSAELTAKASAKAAIFGFVTLSETWDLGKVQLFPRQEKTKLRMKLFSNSNSVTDVNYDNAVMMSRLYSTNVQSSSSAFYLENVYSYAEPKLISLSNGNLMLIWIGDDGTKNAENRTSLFYSIYDGYQWSESIEICENEEFNSSPRIAIDGNDVYIVWQKSSSPIKVGASLAEVLKDADLCYTKYTETGFTEAIAIGQDNELVEFGHSVIPAENGTYVVWYQNSENNIYMDSGLTSLNYSFVDNDGNVSSPTKITETENSILTYDSFIVDGKLNLAISTQENGVNCLKLYDGSSVNDIAQSDYFIGNVLYHDGMIVYLNEANVIGYDLTTQDEKILFENFLGSFEIVNNNDDSYLVTVRSNYEGSSIYVSEYDCFARSFKSLDEYYRTNKYINDYSSAVLNNACMIAIETSEFDDSSDEPFTNYSLEVVGETSYNEIEVGTYAWTNDVIIRGNNIKIGFDVRNTGNTVISSLNYNLVDSATGNVVGNGTINEEIAVGEYKTVELDYVVPNDFLAKEIRIDVSIDGNETDLIDNYAVVDLGQADLEIKNVTLDYDEGKFLLKGNVTNNGYELTTGNVLRIYDTNINGTLISETPVADLQSISSSEFVLELPKSYAYMANEDEYHAVYITVSSDADEYNMANNEFRVVYNDKTWNDIMDSDQQYGGFELGVMKDLSEGFYYGNSSVDIKRYNIAKSESNKLLNAFGEFYNAKYGKEIIGGFKCTVTYNRYTDTIVKIKFMYEPYDNSTNPIEYIDAETDTVNFIKNETKNMNDFEKALYVHDWLVLNGEYDFELADLIDKGLTSDEREQRYLKFGLLVTGKGVCGTYGDAYEYLMNTLGIECIYLSSSYMDHGWNLIKLDGEWYHVDCTWDDPVSDRIGISRYDYFLVNDDEISEKEHSQWTPSNNKSVSAVYSGMPRYDSNKAAYGEDKWCYIFENKLYVSDVYGNNERLISEEKYDAFDIYGDYLYAIKNKSIYKIEINNPSVSYSVYSLKQKPKSIYIDETGLLTYYTNEGKSPETINVNDLSVISSVDFSNNSVTIDNGEKIALNATAYNESGKLSFNMDQFTWLSSDSAVASVDENGYVTPDLPGTAIISASIGDIKAECIVNVNYWEHDISGDCGEKAEWSLDAKTNELRITGNGNIDDFEDGNTPWGKYNSHIESVLIGSEIQKIGQYAFANLTKVSNIIVPPNVKEISEYAFYGCNALGDITLPFVGSTADANGTYDAVLGHIFGRLTSNQSGGTIQYYKQNGEQLSGYSYAIPQSLKKVTITDARIVPFGAFYNCGNIDEIVLNYGVAKIGGSAFREAVSLTELVIPESVVTIEENALLGCNSVTSLTLPFVGSSRTASGTYDAVLGYIFGRTQSGTIQYHRSENGSLYYYNYAIPDSLVEVILTDDEVVPMGAFHNCTNLANIVLNEGITIIGEYAFANASSITELTIPDSVQTIGEDALSGCTSLETLVIPFVGSSRDVSGTYDAVFGHIFGRANEGTVQYYNLADDSLSGYRYAIVDSLKNVVVTDDATIALGAFSNCTTLSTVDFKETTQSIENCAFYGVSALDKLIIRNRQCNIYNSSNCIGISGIIYGYDGSTAEKFANNYSISFVALDDEIHTHTGGTANCKEQAKCLICGEAYGELDFDNHKSIVTDKAVAATCKNTGLTEGSHCSACNIVIVAQTTTAKLKHNYTSKITTPATHLKEGVKTFTCSGCGDKYTETVAKLEGHTYDKTVTAPTCTKEGYTTYTCACGYSYKGDEKDKLGHDFGWIIDAEATCGKTGLKHEKCSRCTETRNLNTTIPATGNHSYASKITTPATHLKEGVKTFTCSGCGDKYTETVAKLEGHTYDKTVTTPTCTEEGYTTYTCACGATYKADEKAKLGHDFGWIIDAEATCGKTGLKHEKCSRCTETRNLNTTIPATGNHSYASEITTPATHLKEGVKTFTCSGCGDKYTETVAKLEGHTYNKTVTAPTCTEDGYTTYTCACGKTYTEAIESPGHSLVNKEAKAPTCSEPGYEAYEYCKICTYTTYKETPPSGHSLVYKEAKAPTCSEPGYEAYECCTVCSYTTFKAVSATGHSYTSKVTTPATHLTTGVMTYTCQCGDSHTDTIAKTPDHTYTVSGTTAADCENKGYTTYICACGSSYNDNYVNALGHDYENGICKRCGDNKAVNCSHMCHKNNFIWKILRFFFKLFKIQPVCDCGVKHY